MSTNVKSELSKKGGVNVVKLTRGGVTYNLYESPFRVVMKYEHNEIIFVFSSSLYKTKFLERINENRISINESLSKRFNITTDFDLLCDIRLYSTIEKRGFLLICEGENLCQKDITLGGVKVTKKN